MALRDADLFVVDARQDVRAHIRNGTMILRTDRRLGFDPTREWDAARCAGVREHGMFQPQIGSIALDTPHSTPARFFAPRPEQMKPVPPWREAMRNRQGDLIGLGAFLTGLIALLGFGHEPLCRGWQDVHADAP